MQLVVYLTADLGVTSLNPAESLAALTFVELDHEIILRSFSPFQIQEGYMQFSVTDRIIYISTC